MTTEETATVNLLVLADPGHTHPVGHVVQLDWMRVDAAYNRRMQEACWWPDGMRFRHVKKVRVNAECVRWVPVQGDKTPILTLRAGKLRTAAGVVHYTVWTGKAWPVRRPLPGMGGDDEIAAEPEAEQEDGEAQVDSCKIRSIIKP